MKRKKILLKKFIKLRKNVQNKSKILHFKKKKWQKLQQFLHNSSFRVHKAFDHEAHIINRYPDYFNNVFRNNLYDKQRFSYYYGYLKMKYIKNLIKNSVNYNDVFAKTTFKNKIECRLDVILYRSKLINSVKKARQFITHRFIKVNGSIIKTYSYVIKKGDLVTIELRRWEMVQKMTDKTALWPFAPEYMQINYRTLQIVLIEEPSWYKSTVLFPYYMNFNTLMKYYKYH